MGALATVLLVLAASAVLVPAAVLFFECALAALAPEPPRRTGDSRPSLAVLVPAHDEEVVIEATVRLLLAELAPTDRLLVIADNCTDRTASVARGAGATVLERNEPDRRGKGFALGYGVRHLMAQPPEVLIIVDADCSLETGSLQTLAHMAATENRPVQARNVVLPAPGAEPLDAVSAFAFLVKNVVRPSGLARLGLPCPLMGTGMAFPWSIICTAPLATSALVEDLQLGLDLTLAGHPPMLCLQALVTSPLPRQAPARASQRRRWEHGQLTALLGNAPRLFSAAARRFDLALVAVALDLCVPPLSLLVLCSLAVLVIAVVVAAQGALWTPAVLAGLAVALVVISILGAWFRFGRGEYRISTLLMAPFYVLGKIPLYVGFVGRRQQAWVRTEREADDQARARRSADPSATGGLGVDQAQSATAASESVTRERDPTSSN